MRLLGPAAQDAIASTGEPCALASVRSRHMFIRPRGGSDFINDSICVTIVLLNHLNQIAMFAVGVAELRDRIHGSIAVAIFDQRGDRVTVLVKGRGARLDD